MDRDDIVKSVFFGIEIIATEVIDKDSAVLGIHDPVFLHAGILILVELKEHILGPGGGGEDFHCEVGGTVKGLCTEIIRSADHEEIGLYHGLVVAVKLYVCGRDQWDAGAVVCGNIIL